MHENAHVGTPWEEKSSSPLNHARNNQGGNVSWLKKVVKLVKLQIPAGKATPAPPVGPALGSSTSEHHGIL